MHFYLLDLERTILSGRAHFWKRSKHGYVTDLAEAGLFNGIEAHKIIVEDHDNRTMMIHKTIVENILKKA